MKAVRFVPWLVGAAQPTAGAGALGATALAVGGVALLVIAGLSVDASTSWADQFSFIGILGAGVAVGVMLPMLVAMALTGSRVSRGVFAGTLVALWAYGALSIWFGFGVLEGWAMGLFSVALFMGPVALVLLLPVLAGVYSCVGGIRDGWLDARRDALREGVRRSGCVAREVAEAAVGELDGLVEDLGLVEHQALLWDRGRLQEREEVLLGMVKTQGRAHLREVEATLKLRPQAARALVRTVAEQGALQGWIDWEAGLLFSEQTAALHARGGCPRCGGELKLGGHGVVACPYCGTELFL